MCAFVLYFFCNSTAPTDIYTLSLHDALPISIISAMTKKTALITGVTGQDGAYLAEFLHAKGYERSEEHTSELQSRVDLVCRLLLEKKKIKFKTQAILVSTRASKLRTQSIDCA